MLRPAQVVAALDAVAALVADEAARGEWAECEQPENRSVNLDLSVTVTCAVCSTVLHVHS